MNPLYQPLVSIVIPVYNGSNYLAQAIDSALRQTYPNIEIIVVNDGSCDGGKTDKVAERYQGKIRYFKKENGGSSSALNLGIQNMRGEWFSWLSHDDLYLPQKVEKQIAYLNQKRLYLQAVENNVLFTDCEYVDAEGRLLHRSGRHRLKEWAAVADGSGENAPMIAEPTKYIFHGCSCLVHRKVFEQIGAFDEKLRLLNDADLWLRIYSNGYRVHFIPECLVQGRLHREQVSKSIGYSYHNPEQDRYWQMCLDWLLKNCKTDEALFYRFGMNAIKKTRYREGNLAFAQAGRIAPSGKARYFFAKNYALLYSKCFELAKKIYLKIQK